MAAQERDPASWLHKHRELLQVRKALPDLWETPAQWSDQLKGTARALRRGAAVAAANFGEAPVAFELPDGQWVLRYDSGFEATEAPLQGVIEVPSERTYLFELKP